MMGTSRIVAATMASLLVAAPVLAQPKPPTPEQRHHGVACVTADDFPTPGGVRPPPGVGAMLDPPGTPTIYYRTANGSTRGTTTSAAAVPAGSVIERVSR